MEEVVKNVALDKPKKEKKKKSKLRITLEVIFYIVFGALCAFVVAGNISGEIHKKENFGQSIRFGVGSFIVLTDSMEPEIPQDSALLTYKEDIESVYERFMSGDTIDVTFANINVMSNFIPDTEEFKAANGGQMIVTNRIMTHRIREMHIIEDNEFGSGRFVFIAAGINTGGAASLEGQYQVFTENEYLGIVKLSNTFLGMIFNFIVSPVGLIILLLVPAGYLIVTSSIDIFKALKTAEAEENTSSTPLGGKLAGVSDKDKERLKKELLAELAAKRKENSKNEKQEN